MNRRSCFRGRWLRALFSALALWLLPLAATLAQAASDDSLCFVVAEDTRGNRTNGSEDDGVEDGINKAVLQAVLEQAGREVCETTGRAPDFLVAPGDLILGFDSYDNNRVQFQNWIDTVTGVKDPSGASRFPLSAVLPGWGGHERNQSPDADTPIWKAFGDTFDVAGTSPPPVSRPRRATTSIPGRSERAPTIATSGETSRPRVETRWLGRSWRGSFF